MRDEELYLRDIVEAAGAIDRFLAGMSEDEWIDDEIRQSAVMDQLIIIGEATSRLPRKFRETHPQIAWTDRVLAGKNTRDTSQPLPQLPAR